ncbi:MAG: aspartate kinase [Bdellovibrionales bacterium]
MKFSENLVIKKFGGTSVGSLEKIELIADRLLKSYQQGQKFIVVISAMSGDTNRLEEMGESIYPAYRGLSYDMLISSGEQVSLALLSMSLEKRGIKTYPMLGYQLGIHTDSFFSKANIQAIETKKIKKVLKEGAIPLVAGFQGVTKEKEITTLGRGGSDLTAVALAVVLKQNSCEIYTDVSGVLTGDPKIIPSARKIQELGFSEMMEMSALGAKVLQIRCIELAAKHKIKIHVRDAFKEEEGTWIVDKEDFMEGSVVSAVSHDLNTVIIRIKKIPNKDLDFLSKLFKQLGEKSIFVDIISKTEVSGQSSLSFSVSKTDFKDCLDILKQLIPTEDVSLIDKVCKISIIGVGMSHHSGVASRFFSVFQSLGVHLHLVTTSEIKISAIIDQDHLKKVAQALHSEFQLSK